MRITNPTLLRGYNRDLNRVMNLKNKSEHMITTTRRFSRASEDALSAAKALNVRKSQYYSEQHQENLKVASKFYTEAETSLIQVSEQMATIRETIIAAVNTTKDQEEYNIYAQQLETKAEELCAIFNTDSAGRAIFGGESDNSLPFDILKDSNGHPATVTYHGIPVNAMNDPTKFPYADEVNVDIGLGMVVNQETHEVDPDSVLKISFNGPEVTGCGAERGVADIDLSSIMKDRTYSLYVYAGDVKKEINFKGLETQEANVQQINDLLKEAYKKEIAYGRNYPKMDNRGMISLRDKMGDAVEGGIVSVINNPYPEKHTSQLKIDNDSNYTDKYKLRLSELPEGETLKVDVQVGDGERKTIEFESGTDNVSDPNNPVFAEDITVQNFQKALDKAFGFDKEGRSVVTISPDDPTKGVISAEGQSVKLFSGVNTSLIDLEGFKQGEEYTLRFSVGNAEKEIKFTAGADKAANKEAIENELSGFANIDDDGKVTAGNKHVIVEKVGEQTSYAEADITTTSTDVNDSDTLSLTGLKEGTSYAMNVSIGGGAAKVVVFRAEKSVFDTKNAIADAVKKEFETDYPNCKVMVNNKGEFTFTDNAGNDKTVKLTEVTGDALNGNTSIELGQTSKYQIDMTSFENGKEYSLKFIVDNKVKNITFTAGADNLQTINDALGGFATLGADGTITAPGGVPVTISNNPAAIKNKDMVFERECAYSYNYIQLTLDAARALREGDIDYANGCIDRLVESNERLLVEIADLGCNEEFIDFNISRLTVRDQNLAERQNDLEIIDPAKQITLWKQYEAMYNACLQMSSSVVPQSIFDYI